jgi:hypothetical protein
LWLGRLRENAGSTSCGGKAIGDFHQLLGILPSVIAPTRS